MSQVRCLRPPRILPAIAAAAALVTLLGGSSGRIEAQQVVTQAERVIAVSKTPRKPDERIKTDRRDEIALARYLRFSDHPGGRARCRR